MNDNTNGGQDDDAILSAKNEGMAERRRPSA